MRCRVSLWGCLCQIAAGDNGSLDVSSLLGLVGVPAVTCSVGYTGLACKECIRPGYYRLGDRCLPCPKTAYGIIVGAVVVAGTLHLVGAAPSDPQAFLSRPGVNTVCSRAHQ